MQQLSEGEGPAEDSFLVDTPDLRGMPRDKDEDRGGWLENDDIEEF